MIIGGRMYLCYNNQKIELCCQDGFKNRLMGIMFKKDKLNKALYFKRCNSIHTFFCKQDIAVIMTDKNDRIIYFNNKVKSFIASPMFLYFSCGYILVNLFINFCISIGILLLNTLKL